MKEATMKHHPDCIGHSENRFGCPTSPAQEKLACPICEINPCERHSVKPTQDIESWEESVRQARHLATTRPQLLAGLLKEIETARTQGAEAAVEYIKDSLSSDLVDEDDYVELLDRSFKRILVQAKKV